MSELIRSIRDLLVSPNCDNNDKKSQPTPCNIVKNSPVMPTSSQLLDNDISTVEVEYEFCLPKPKTQRELLLRNAMPLEMVREIISFCCKKCSMCHQQRCSSNIRESVCTYAARSVDDDISWFVRPRNIYDSLCEDCVTTTERRGLVVRKRTEYW